MVDNKTLTPHGKAFLIAALDPMHDNQIQDLAGWPDLADQASVVRTFKKSHTVTKPIGGSGGNWDLMLMSMPILSQVTVNPVDHKNNVYSNANTALSLLMGGVSMVRVDSGLDDYSVETVSSVNVQDKIAIPLDQSIAEGNGRLVGMGIEVVNTTAPLHKQGTVHVFRTPQLEDVYDTCTFQQNQTIGAVTVPTPYPFTGRQVQMFPVNEESTTLLPGTLTWDAKEGCYLVVPFVSTNNPIKPQEFVQPIAVDEFQIVVNGSVSEAEAATTFPVADAGINGIFFPWKWAPTHSAGALFTGLSAETTLTVTVNYYYEYFPSSFDKTLITLAKPSASYDPVALSLYSEVLGSLPIGVRAKENGIGGWFADIVSRFGGAVGTALTPIFGPAAAGAGVAAQQMANSYLASQSPQTGQLRKPKQQNQQQKPRTVVQVVRPPKRGPPPPLPSRAQFKRDNIPGNKLTKAQKRRLREAGII